MITDKIYSTYIDILKWELVPAMGCTEPISLAYGAAKCREILGCTPSRITARCSGNIVKNVRCVKIPHSDGMTGIASAVVLGALGGNCHKELEVLCDVTKDDIVNTHKYISENRCDVQLLDSTSPLHFILTMEGNGNTAEIEICENHTNIIRIEKNGEIIFTKAFSAHIETPEYGLLNLDDIKEFADSVAIDDVKEVIGRQIIHNMAIAQEGFDGKYGIGIARIITESYPDNTITKMKAMAASASEARMGGCELPVIVNSGSGNQGITASVPVIVYAQEKGYSEDKLIRGLVFSNLLAVYQKIYIGTLSAFCGAVSAACSAGATITYMCDGSTERIRSTIENTLANIPGIICDGAKISCAAKIATSVDAAYLAHKMAMKDASYVPHTGILQATISETISCVGTIGKDGMKETDREILKIMMNGDECI